MKHFLPFPYPLQSSKSGIISRVTRLLLLNLIKKRLKKQDMREKNTVLMYRLDTCHAIRIASFNILSV